MMTLQQLTLAQLEERFPEDVRPKLRALLAREGTVALVLYENQQLDSSAFGDSTAVAVGPGRTYKTVEEAAAGHLNDLPSQRQYPVAYVAREDA